MLKWIFVLLVLAAFWNRSDQDRKNDQAPPPSQPSNVQESRVKVWDSVAEDAALPSDLTISVLPTSTRCLMASEEFQSKRSVEKLSYSAMRDISGCVRIEDGARKYAIYTWDRLTKQQKGWCLDLVRSGPKSLAMPFMILATCISGQIEDPHVNYSSE